MSEPWNDLKCSKGAGPLSAADKMHVPEEDFKVFTRVSGYNFDRHVYACPENIFQRVEITHRLHSASFSAAVLARRAFFKVSFLWSGRSVGLERCCPVEVSVMTETSCVCTVPYSNTGPAVQV